MSRTVAEILDEALALPEPARAELAELLAVSLSMIPRSPNSAWAAEIRRRAAEVDDGYARVHSGPVPSSDPKSSTRREGTNGHTANGLPQVVASFPKRDAEGRLLAITDEERRVQWAMRLAALEEEWGTHGDQDEHITDEMWDEIMRNLGNDPTVVRGLES